MTIDYDVVIIGGSLTGRYAALSATKLKAKVALVEPKANNVWDSIHARYQFVYDHAFRQIGELTRFWDDAALFGLHTSCTKTGEKCQISVDLPQALQYAQSVVSNLQQLHSPTILTAQGVDFIVGNGQFQASPHLAFAVNNRLLRARNYLLATGSCPAIPEIDGLQKTGFLTLPQVWQFLHSQTQPQSWVIIGGVPQSVELAQTLRRLGCSVTFIVHRPSILPHADFEVAQLLCSQLEAEGVNVLTHTLVTQVRRIEDKKWLQAGDRAIETDEIVVAVAQQPNVEFLNLAAVDVKWNLRRLLVNEKLQTTNNRIWACGDVIGGYEFFNIANYEAGITLQNALFFPRFKVNYQCVPWAIFTHPMFAQVGLTEAQAKRRYNPHQVLVLRQYFKTLASAQLQSQTTGICKFIVLRNGNILGASILGAEAGELINLVALAIAQNIKVDALAHLASIRPSFSEILQQTAKEWFQQKLSQNLIWQNCLENFFFWRRHWNL